MNKVKSKYHVGTRYLLLVACLILVAFLGTNILELLNEKLPIERILHVSQDAWKDVGAWVISIMLIGIVAKDHRKVRLDLLQLSLLLVILELYIIARYGFSGYNMTRSYFASWITYSDILFLPLIAIITRHGFQCLFLNRASPVIDGKHFDRYLTDPSEDLFGYTKLAARVKDYLQDPLSPSTITIGINGEFGIGKTTLLNFLKKDIQSEEFTIVFFTPWHSATKPFLTQLVDQLVGVTHGDNQNLAGALRKYDELLTGAKVPRGIAALLTAGRYMHGSTDSNAKQRVDDLIKESGKRFVVIIDDLDRLLPLEIVEVLKLIRNTTDFENISYVVAYDKVLIEEALERVQPIGTEFLDKFVQMELVLPIIEGNDLLKLCYTTLSELMPADVSGYTLEEFIASIQPVANFVRTPRQAKRLAITTKLIYGNLTSDIYLPDAACLQCLRLRYPKVISLIARERSTMFTTGDNTQNPSPSLSLAQNRDKSETLLAERLRTDFNILGIKKQQIDDLISSINNLFKQNQFFRYDSYYSICLPRNFERYFNYDISSSTIPEILYIMS